MKKIVRNDYESVAIRTSGGTRQYRTKLCTGPVRYLDGNEWRTIDTSFASAGQNAYHMTGNFYKLQAPRHADGHISYQCDKHGVDFIPQCNHVEGVLTGSNTITYANAFGDGVDLVLSASNGSLKKLVVIRHRPTGGGDWELKFELSMHGFAQDANFNNFRYNRKFSIAQDSDYSLHFLDPAISDGAGNVGIVDARIVKEGSRTFLIKRIPATYLASALYPLVTDATVTSIDVPSQDGFQVHITSSWYNARLGAGTLSSASVITARATYDAGGAEYDVRRGYVSFDLDTAFTAVPEESLQDIAVIDCTLGMYKSAATSGNATIVLVGNTAASPYSTWIPVSTDFTRYGTVKYIDPWNVSGSSGLITTTFNASGKYNLETNLRGLIPYVHYRILQYSNDFINVQPTGLNSVSFYSAETGGSEPYVDITWEVSSSYSAGGYGVIGGSHTLVASSRLETGGVSGQMGGSAGIVISDGTRITTSGISLITNVATIDDVIATTEDTYHPARNLRFPEKPFKTYRQGQNTVGTWLTFYLDRMCDTILFYNFSFNMVYLRLSPTQSWTLATPVTIDIDTGIRTLCFRCSEMFSTFRAYIFHGATQTYGYELGSVLCGTRTELPVKPQYPFIKSVAEYVSELEYDAGNVGVYRIGRSNFRIAYNFPVMTQDNFDTIKAAELSMGARGLCGIHEKRDDYETSYIVLRDGDFQYSDEEYRNMRASFNFIGVS